MSEQEIIDNWLNMRQQQPVQLATEEAYWQQARIQAAIAAMQAHIGDEEYMSRISRNLKQDDNEIVKFVVKCSVMYADALIAELQKKRGQYE